MHRLLQFFVVKRQLVVLQEHFEYFLESPLVTWRLLLSKKYPGHNLKKNTIKPQLFTHFFTLCRHVCQFLHDLRRVLFVFNTEDVIPECNSKSEDELKE